MKTVLIALLLFTTSPALADTSYCYKTVAPAIVSSIGKSVKDADEVCIQGAEPDDFETDLYSIDQTGPAPVVVRKSPAAIATIDAARAAKAKAARRAAKANAELERKGWTAGELTRRLSGGLAILSRVVIALANSKTPAAADIATLEALEPELARYEISGANLVTTVKQLADARAEVGSAIASDRDPDLHTVKDKDEIKD